MTDQVPPIRADHIGSLKRPPELVAAREAFDAGTLSAAGLKEVEDKAIRDVVAMQERIGLKSITDGEFRRRSYWADFMSTFSGVEAANQASEGWDFVDATGDRLKAPMVTVTEKVRWSGSRMTEEFRFLAAATRETPKITIPSPIMAHYYGGRDRVDRSAYPDLDELWSDFATAYQAQIRDLYDAGCRVLQLDETSTAKICDPNIRDILRRRGEDPDRLAETYADIVNRILDGAPADMVVGIHLCRGNQRGHWQASGGYEFVADTLFNKVAADRYYLEYDTPRAGDFSPLRFLPEPKVAVLGLISTKTAELESRDELLRRIDEASAIVPLERLCISPQCGFSSSLYGNPVTIDDEIRKLELLVAIADEVWGSEVAAA